MVVSIVLPAGSFLPMPAIIVHVGAMISIAVLHAIYHIGLKGAGLFFSVVIAIEWCCEQINVSFDGIVFGHVIYKDALLGPKLGDIPLVVPLAFAALCWPTYVLINLILKNSVVFRDRDEKIWSVMWRCLLYAMANASWSFAVEPACLKMGFYYYTAHVGDPNTFFGVPMSEFRGWTVMAFFQFFIFFGLLAPRLNLPAERPVHRLVDAAPLILFGGFAAFLTLNPIHSAIGAVTLWTMGLLVLLSSYKLIQGDSIS